MTDARTYTIDEVEQHTGFDRRTIAYYVQQGVLPKVGRRGPRTRYPSLFLDRLRFISMVRDLQNQGAAGPMTLSDFRDLFRRVPAETIAEAVRSGTVADGLAGDRASVAADMASPRDRAAALARRIDEIASGDGERFAVPLETRGRALDSDAEEPHAVTRAPHFEARTYRSLADGPPPSLHRDVPSGEHHRLTLDALERSPDAPEPARLSAPAPPVEDELREALARLHGVVRRQPRAYLRTTETWTRARITEEITVSARGLEERHLPLLERVARILRRLTREGDSGTDL